MVLTGLYMSGGNAQEVLSIKDPTLNTSTTSNVLELPLR